MVVVQVEWLAGRTPEQKEELVAGITDILGRVGDAQRENVHVVLHDVPPSNWGWADELVEPPQRGSQEEPTGGAADGVEAVTCREEARRPRHVAGVARRDAHLRSGTAARGGHVRLPGTPAWLLVSPAPPPRGRVRGHQAAHQRLRRDRVR